MLTSLSAILKIIFISRQITRPVNHFPQDLHLEPSCPHAIRVGCCPDLPPILAWSSSWDSLCLTPDYDLLFPDSHFPHFPWSVSLLQERIFSINVLKINCTPQQSFWEVTCPHKESLHVWALHFTQTTVSSVGYKILGWTLFPLTIFKTCILCLLKMLILLVKGPKLLFLQGFVYVIYTFALIIKILYLCWGYWHSPTLI